MSGFIVRIAAAPALAELSKLTRVMGNREIPNRQLAAVFQRHVFRQFQTGGTAYPTRGPSWSPLSPRRAAWKARHGYSVLPLLVTGELRNSYLPIYDNTMAGIRSLKDYAAPHEEGSAAINLPQRSVLPTDAQALDYAVRVYSNYIYGRSKAAGESA